MKPKEKAHELFEKMYNKIQSDELGLNYQSAQECALIAVKYLWDESEYADGYYQRSLYWNEVKQEIEKL
jgi:hypothetical protein